MIQFRGKIDNSIANGYSADEGFRKTAYFRSLREVDWDIT